MSQVIDRALVRGLRKPQLGPDSDKDARGRVLVVGGSAEVPGAIILTGEGALRSGAGKLQLVARTEAAAALGLAVPEARIIAVPAGPDGQFGKLDVIADFAGRCDAVVVGPGLLDDVSAGHLAQRLIEQGGSAAFLLDAAALTSLRPEVARKAAGRLVITPHAGEMAALSGRSKAEVLADPLAVARATAAGLQAVVVMKGKHTFVVTPDGAAWLHEDGVVGLATGGSGDVLAGVIGGLLARGYAPADAAILGVYLHGQAGVRLSRQVGPLGFLARELPAQIPAAMAELERA